MTYRDSQNVAAEEGWPSGSPRVRTTTTPPGSSAATLPLHRHPNAVDAARRVIGTQDLRPDNPTPTRRVDPTRIYLTDGSIIECDLRQLEGDNALGGYWVKTRWTRGQIVGTFFPSHRVSLIEVGR